LITTLKELLQENFSYAIGDLEAAEPYFDVVKELQELSAHLSIDHQALLEQSKDKEVGRLLNENAPFINFVLRVSDRIHHIASSMNDCAFL
jgi:hypothetical protein